MEAKGLGWNDAAPPQKNSTEMKRTSMKTKFNFLAAAFFLAAVTAGFGQPVITQQPQSCTNYVGTTASFNVTAAGTRPLAPGLPVAKAGRRLVGPCWLH
jgi:hypothetical protein